MITAIKNFFKPEIGTYVSVKYSILTTSLLSRWMEIKKIPNPVSQEKLHTTVLYSRKQLDKEHHVNISKTQLEVRSWRFSPDRLDIFGEGQEQILVLRIKAPELIWIHDGLIYNGGTHDFPLYDPHITLSYDIPKDFDLSKIDMPPIYLIPTEIKTEKLKL